MIRRIATGLLCTPLLWVVPSAVSARGLDVGYFDPAFSAGPAPAAPALADAAADGSNLVRVQGDWSQLAPRRPADGRDPADPAYVWGGLDRAVEGARDAGLPVLVTVQRAPAWAEGAARPRSAPPGTWKPDAAAFGAFATALAARYRGGYVDPRRPTAPLPAVRALQAWNEPNLSTYLTPQYGSGRDRDRPASPARYRTLLNAFARGVRASGSKALVVTAGTAPFGDYGAPRRRVPPARFVRELLCFADATLHPAPCPDPPRFDVLAHHPYSIAGPARHALNPDDVALPDMARLTAPLHRAERLGRVVPRGTKPVWVTELSWDSSPPTRTASRRRRRPAGCRVRSRSCGARASAPCCGSGSATRHRTRATRRPTSRAPASSTAVRSRRPPPSPSPSSRTGGMPPIAVWGRAPTAGTAVIEARSGASWRAVRRMAVRAGGVFQATVRLRGASTLRARLGDRTSLTSSVR